MENLEKIRIQMVKLSDCIHEYEDYRYKNELGDIPEFIDNFWEKLTEIELRIANIIKKK